MKTVGIAVKVFDIIKPETFELQSIAQYRPLTTLIMDNSYCQTCSQGFWFYGVA